METPFARLLPDALLIGLPEVDAQHEEIFNRIESLKATCFEHCHAPFPEFESLVAFFAHHFATEERIAEQAGLEFSLHIKAHRTNQRVLKKALDEVRSGVRDAYSFMRYVELWFERHIIEEDQPFSASLRSRRQHHRPAPAQFAAGI